MEHLRLREIGQKIRLVVCDLDGTLLNSAKEISERSVRAVTAARKKGVCVTICSGRIYPMLGYYIRRLGIEGAVISANGAAIVNASDGAVLAGTPLDAGDALRLMEFCRESGLDYSALTARDSFFAPDSVRIGRFRQYNEIAAASGVPPMGLRFFDSGHRCMAGQAIYKMLIYERSGGELERAKAFIDRRTGLECTSSEDRLMDISAPGVSKGSGLETLARLMGVPLEQTCAFGDYDNDLPMLRVAGLPVAMANGRAAVRDAAAYITASNDEDGVAAALERFIL